MLYIFIILLILLFLVGCKIQAHFQPAYDFNLQETLPLRAFLAICVMLTHLCPYLVAEVPLLNDFGLWGPPSVGAFFLLAGYGLAFSYKKKGTSYLNGFFKKRLLRLLWPLLVMTVMYQSYLAYSGGFSLKEMLASPSPMSWFIYALVVWYAGYYVAFKVGGARNVQITLVWVFTVAYLVFTIWQHLGYYYISILPMPLAMTYVFYEDRARAFVARHAWRVWLAIVAIVVAVMGYAVAGQYGMRLPGWGLPVYTVVPCTMVYIVYYLGGWKNCLTNFLGRISYEFYIVHGFIVMQLGPCRLFELTGYANALIIILLVFGLTIFSAWMMSVLCSVINRQFKLFRK